MHKLTISIFYLTQYARMDYDNKTIMSVIEEMIRVYGLTPINKDIHDDYELHFIGELQQISEMIKDMSLKYTEYFNDGWSGDIKDGGCVSIR